MNLFGKARAQLPLTPWERTILKLLQSLLIAVLIALAPVVANLLGQDSIVWANAFRVLAATASMAILNALWKYFQAQGDSPLLTAADPVYKAAVQRLIALGANDVKTEPPLANAPSDAEISTPTP
jgi:hypothetical protein